jgi:hypothetical protein
MKKFETGCLNYFNHKEVAPDKQVRKILSCFKDSRITDWIANERERLLTLSFTEFMSELRDGYLDKDWEEGTCRELLGMLQHSSSFCDYTVRVQARNSLLVATDSHLPDEKLRHQLEAGMNERLSKRCKTEKVNKVVKFRDWLAEVKRVDDALQDDRCEWEAMSKNNRDNGRKTNILAEPSRRYNTQYPSTSTTTCILLPKLTESERKLLSDNDGCFKCRTFFADHRSPACKADFPNPVSYKPLTQSNVDKAKKSRNNKNVSAILPSLDNSDENIFVPTHPVAAIVGTSSHPYAYQAPNATSVIESKGGSDSNKDEVCQSSHLFWNCSTFSANNPFPVATSALIDNGSHLVLIHPNFV